VAESETEPIEIVLQITMASETHTLSEVQGLVDAVWGLYAGALLAAFEDQTDPRLVEPKRRVIRALASRRRRFRRHPSQVVASIKLLYQAVTPFRSGEEVEISEWGEVYAFMSRILRDIAEEGGPDFVAGAKVQRLEHHSPLVFEVLFSAAFAPLAAMSVIAATCVAVIRLRESNNAATYRERERDVALRIREAVAEEVRTNGVGSVDPSVVTAAMSTQVVPARELLSPAIKDIVMSLTGTRVGK